MAGAGTYKNKVNANQNKLIEYAFFVCVCVLQFNCSERTTDVWLFCNILFKLSVSILSDAACCKSN